MLECMIAFAKKTAKQTVIVGGDIDGYTCLHDLRQVHGPVAGIEALLSSSLDTTYLVVGCDMPLLQPEHVQPLLVQSKSAVFTHENATLGLPLSIHSETHKQCRSYLDSGKKSIRGFVNTIEHATVPVLSENIPFLTSMNTPEEIAKGFTT